MPAFIRLTLVGVIALSAACAKAPPPTGPMDFSAIDAHALSAPPEVEQSVGALARYLVRPARNDTERARAIYRWITANIAYDVESYLTGNIRRVAGWDEVLQTRVAICDGYSALFEHLATRAGLDVVRIEGFAKGAGTGARIDPAYPNHAWNAVRLDGRWRLIDSTWGAGHIGESQTFVHQFSDHWFLVDPEVMSLTHWPVEQRWQLVSRPLSRQQFERQPVVPQAFFDLGFELSQIRQQIANGSPLPHAYTRPGRDIRVVRAPIKGVLQAGGEYDFSLKVPGAVSVSLVNAGEWHDLSSDGGRFEGSIRPRAGDLQLHAAFSGAGEGYRAILVYTVN